MKSKTVIVGFFSVPGFGPDSVETSVTGNGPRDYAALQTAIFARHPGVRRSDIVRTGSKIEQRTGTTQNYLGDVPGQTIRQLFDGALALDKPLPAVLLGRCFFSGAPYDIALLFSRSSGQAGVVLRPRTPTSGIVSFQNKINPMILVTELPQLVREILGGDARDIRLNTRPPAPAPTTPTPAPAPAPISKTPENVAEIHVSISKTPEKVAEISASKKVAGKSSGKAVSK